MPQPIGLKLDHVAMPVRDPEVTLAFYRGVLGLPLIAVSSGDDWDGYAWLLMSFGLDEGHEFSVVTLRGAPAPDYRRLPVDARHYAFSVATDEELDRWRARLSRADVDFWEERHGEQRSLYFADPDAIVLEITSPPSARAKIAVPGLDQLVVQWSRSAATA